MLSVNHSITQHINWLRLDLFDKQPLHIKGFYRPSSRGRRTEERLQRDGKQVGFSALQDRVTCCLCQEHTINPIITPCNHIYCHQCISRWLVGSVSCPDCQPDFMLAKAHRPGSSASPAKYSSSQAAIPSHLEPAVKDNLTNNGVGPDPGDLSKRLEEVLKRFPQLGADPVSAKPVLPNARNASRTWCMQRRTPLRNRAAHPLIQLDLEPSTPRAQSSLSYILDTPSSPISFASQKVSHMSRNYGGSPKARKLRPPELKFFTERETSSSISSPPLTNAFPRTPELDAYAPTPPLKSRHRRSRSISLFLASAQLPPLTADPATSPSPNITIITPHIMFANMDQASVLIASDPNIPYRCRAAAKCVWREWREILLSNEGKRFYTQTLLEALRKSFEQTIVEYGWAKHWRELPAEFVDRMTRARWEVVFGGKEVLDLLGSP